MVARAYQAENLAGSCLTWPLRAYDLWFHDKIQTSGTAWKI